MPPPPAPQRWTWETDNREKGAKIIKLVSESKLLSLITIKLAETRDMEEEGKKNKEKRFLTPAGIDTWAKAIYDGLSKEGKEEVGWIKVTYPPDTPPEGENLHTALPEGENTWNVDRAEEFAWDAWSNRTGYQTEPRVENDRYWDWFKPPGEGFEPYNRRLIAKAKENQIAVWMKKNDQPFSWDRIRNYRTVPDSAGEQPTALNTWNDFHGWRAKTFDDYGKDAYAEWSASHKTPTRPSFEAAMARPFEAWKRRRTMDQFLELRENLERQHRDGNEEARAEVRALLHSMPDIEYVPLRATSEEVPELAAEAAPARRSTRSGAIIPAGPWKWPSEKKGNRPRRPKNSAT